MKDKSWVYTLAKKAGIDGYVMGRGVDGNRFTQHYHQCSEDELMRFVELVVEKFAGSETVVAAKLRGEL